MDADFILTGKIVAKENSLQIQIRITEAEISQVLTLQDVYGENLDRNFVKDLCQGLVVKLRDDLPLIEGRIAKTSDEKIIINLGERDRIRPGMHLIFFQEGEPIKDPETGEILGADSEELGTARIKTLLPKMSHAELLDADALSRLEIGQRLIMK